jgi:ubiquinone/menaquinone biosynthesis C-methylase UbiE
VTQSSRYVIRGGSGGRERLRVLGRVMHPSTTALLDRCGLRDGMRCLDAGCGGGDVSLELARRVAPGGHVVGIDVDEEKLRIAREEAAHHGVVNATFHAGDVREAQGPFDLVYARFLLTHLGDPAGMLAAFHDRLRPGGLIVVEDIDFSAHFTYPESPAFRRYHDLYCAVVARRGGDANIGPRLASLVQQAGFDDITVDVVQPMGLRGESKLMSALTMERIVGAVLEDGRATKEEADALVRELYALADDPSVLAGVPRVFQVTGRRS